MKYNINFGKTNVFFETVLALHYVLRPFPAFLCRAWQHDGNYRYTLPPFPGKDRSNAFLVLYLFHSRFRITNSSCRQYTNPELHNLITLSWQSSFSFHVYELHIIHVGIYELHIIHVGISKSLLVINISRVLLEARKSNMKTRPTKIASLIYAIRDWSITYTICLQMLDV